jgi:hypothetical protein
LIIIKKHGFLLSYQKSDLKIKLLIFLLSNIIFNCFTFFRGLFHFSPHLSLKAMDFMSQVGYKLTDAATPLAITRLRLCRLANWYRAYSLRPTHTGMPITMAGKAMPATRAMPTGAPTRVPSCQRIFFFRDQGFLPQKVHPEGLHKELNQLNFRVDHKTAYLR